MSCYIIVYTTIIGMTESDPELYLSDIDDVYADEDRELEDGLANVSLGDDDDDGNAGDGTTEPAFDVSGKKCWDVGLASEDDVEGFLAEDADNIVFIQESGKASLCIERETVKRALLNNKANYYYLCRGAFEPVRGTLPYNVGNHNICEVPMFGLGFLGLSSKGMVLRSNFVNAIDDTDDQVFVIRSFDPPVKASAVAGAEYTRTSVETRNAVSASHCQPDTGDELFYLTASKRNIVPAHIHETVQTLLDGGCLVKKDESTLTQVAYDGRPATGETEAALRALKGREDFAIDGESSTSLDGNYAINDGEGYDSESEFDDDGDDDGDVEDYEDSVLQALDVPETARTMELTTNVANLFLEEGLLGELSPDANADLALRMRATQMIRRNLPAYYYTTLLEGFARSHSGMITTELTSSAGEVADYTLKTIVKLDSFPPPSAEDGDASIGEQTLNIVSSTINELKRKMEGIVESSGVTPETDQVRVSIGDTCLWMGNTDAYEKNDSVMTIFVCVNMSTVLNEGGSGFENEEVASSYVESARNILDASNAYLSSSNPLQPFVIPVMPLGMEILQFKLQETSDDNVSRVTVTDVAVGQSGRAMNRNLSHNLVNLFTYFA